MVTLKTPRPVGVYAAKSWNRQLSQWSGGHTGYEVDVISHWSEALSQKNTLTCALWCQENNIPTPSKKNAEKEVISGGAKFWDQKNMNKWNIVYVYLGISQLPMSSNLSERLGNVLFDHFCSASWKILHSLYRINTVHWNRSLSKVCGIFEELGI